MDKKEFLRATVCAGFSNLNGQIMRMCNILDSSQRNLNAVYSLCKTILILPAQKNRSQKALNTYVIAAIW